MFTSKCQLDWSFGRLQRKKTDVSLPFLAVAGIAWCPTACEWHSLVSAFFFTWPLLCVSSSFSYMNTYHCIYALAGISEPLIMFTKMLSPKKSQSQVKDTCFWGYHLAHYNYCVKMELGVILRTKWQINQEIMDSGANMDSWLTDHPRQAPCLDSLFGNIEMITISVLWHFRRIKWFYANEGLVLSLDHSYN